MCRIDARTAKKVISTFDTALNGPSLHECWGYPYLGFVQEEGKLLNSCLDLILPADILSCASYNSGEANHGINTY